MAEVEVMDGRLEGGDASVPTWIVHLSLAASDIVHGGIKQLSAVGKGPR